MAMIKCPKCNEEISDKSTKCVHCGEVFVEEPKYFCEECGTEIKKNSKVCSKCGCPVNKETDSKPQQVEVTKVKLGNGISKKKLITIIVIIVAIIGVGLIGTNIYKQNEVRKETERIEAANKQYKSDLSTISYKMLSGAAEAESCGNKIKKVWSNSIWEESDPETDKYTKKNGIFNDDFNDSLSALFSDSDFVKITDGVKQNQKEVNQLFKNMKNPPEDWKDAYDDLKTYYDNYITLTNLCINPSGSLQTFSNNFSQADTDTVNGYEKMKTYIEE